MFTLITIHQTAPQKRSEERNHRTTELLRPLTVFTTPTHMARQKVHIDDCHEIARVHRQAEIRREGDARESGGLVGRVAVPEGGEVGAEVVGGDVVGPGETGGGVEGVGAL